MSVNEIEHFFPVIVALFIRIGVAYLCPLVHE